MITPITIENYQSEVEKSTLPVVIDAYATWCGPCQHMAPIFEEVASELATTHKFAKLNIDEARDIAIKLQISSVPTFVFVKNGAVVGKETGYMSKDILKQKILSILG